MHLFVSTFVSWSLGPLGPWKVLEKPDESLRESLLSKAETSPLDADLWKRDKTEDDAYNI